MTFGSGFTLLIKRLNRFQKLVGERWSQGASCPGPGGGGTTGGPSGDMGRQTLPPAPQPPSPRAAPAHWIMSSSFSTLAKVATLFLSRYRCPGPPCKRLRLAGWGLAPEAPTAAPPRSTHAKGRGGAILQPRSWAGGAEPYLAENQQLPDLGPLVVDVQLLLYLLWRGEGVSAAPRPPPLVCSPAPGSAPRLGARTQNVLECCVLVVLGQTKATPCQRAPPPLAARPRPPPPAPRQAGQHSRRGWG